MNVVSAQTFRDEQKSGEEISCLRARGLKQFHKRVLLGHSDEIIVHVLLLVRLDIWRGRNEAANKVRRANQLGLALAPSK